LAVTMVAAVMMFMIVVVLMAVIVMSPLVIVVMIMVAAMTFTVVMLMIFSLIMAMPVGMAEMSLAVFPVEQEMGAGNAASLLLLYINGEAGNSKLGKLGAQIVDGDAEVEERGEDHVAASAALHVEGEGGHGWLFLLFELTPLFPLS
jgi:hypothetical protein